MNKVHVTIVAALLAAAAVLGAVAVTHTVSLGAAQRQSSNAAVEARTRQLDQLQSSLRKALAAKPKARAAAPAAAAPAPRIVYHRPPPIVVVRHSSHHGDDGSFENADGGGVGGDG